MIKKCIAKTALLVSVCAAALTGCVSASAENAAVPPKPENLTGHDMTEAGVLAENYMNGFIGGLKSGDFKPFESAIPQEAKGKVTEEMFNKLCRDLQQNLGTLTSAEYLGELDQTLVRDYLWKLTFEKKQENGTVDRKEVVYMVRIGRMEGKFRIAGSGFRF